MGTTAYRDYSLTPEHRELRHEIARFADEVIKPRARAIDQEEAYPLDLLKRLAEARFTHAHYPGELGGTDRDSLSWSLIIAEVARASGSTGLALGVTGTASLPILHLGTDEQKQVLLPILEGETPGVYAQSEPEQGSDVARIRTVARPAARDDTDGWEITGHKLWISNAYLGEHKAAAWAGVLAQTGEVGDRRSMRFFLVPLDAAGVEVQKVNTNGMRGSGTSQIFLDHVWVPDNNIVGRDEAGFQAAMRVLGASRIFFSARGLGITEAAVDHAQRVLERVRGEGAGEREPRLVQAEIRLRELEAEAFQLRLLVYRVSRMRDDGLRFDHDVALVKKLAGDTVVRVTSQAYEVVRSLKGTPEELMDADRFVRDGFQIPLAEGTSEIMERIAARDLANSLRREDGPSIGKLLENREELEESIARAQDPVQAAGLMLDLAEAAYRHAVNAAQGRQVNGLFPLNGDDPVRTPLSPIPSPREEPLGAERALAHLEGLARETEALQDGLAGVAGEGLEFPAEAAARRLLASKATAALGHAQGVFEALGATQHWHTLISTGSPQRGSGLVGAAQRAVASTGRGRASPNIERVEDDERPVAPPPGRPPERSTGGGDRRGGDEDLERFRQGPQELPSVQVNEPLVRLFAKVSGDHNPYHLDPEYAKQSRYQGQIGHGILTVVLAVSEISRALPHLAPYEIEVGRFLAPVRFGDRVRPFVLNAERERNGWRLAFVVANQDDVDILQGSVRLRLRTEGDGPFSWTELVDTAVDRLRWRMEEWASDVEPFDVRTAPKFERGQTAEYASTVSDERVKANLVLTQDSHWLNAVFAMEAVAQASAEFAPGYILVGMETGDCTRPFRLGEPLRVRSTITRVGTLAHRPLDRIRIDMDVLDSEDHVVASGAVYKESEGPVGTPKESPGPAQGVEFIVPPSERMLNASARLHLQPYVTIIDLDTVDSEVKPAAREAVVKHLRDLPPEKHRGFIFLRLSGLRTPWAAADLLEVVGKTGDVLDGVVVGDVRDPEDLRVTDRVLTGIEQAHGWEPGRLKIAAALQRPEAARYAWEIAHSSPRLATLTNALPGSQATLQLAEALTRAAHNAGVDAVDGTTHPADDGRLTASGAIHAAIAGFQRRWAHNPIQLNAVLNPTLYLSGKDMQLAAIPEAWERKALAHEPGKTGLWSESRTSWTARETNVDPVSLGDLESLAALEEPLLADET